MSAPQPITEPVWKALCTFYCMEWGEFGPFEDDVWKKDVTDQLTKMGFEVHSDLIDALYAWLDTGTAREDALPPFPEVYYHKLGPIDVLQAQIHDFMVKAGQECPEKPKIPNTEVSDLRVALICEELQELEEALEDDNIRDAYDAILDLLVVVIGTGVALGLDLQPGWDEVHRSNMTKFIDGFRREDGKWMKGPSYSPARLQPIIDAQL